VRKVAGNWLARGSVPIAWAVIVIIFSALRPATFPTIGTFGAIFGSQAVLVIVTLGLLVPLRAGDYDLSVAGTLTLSSMIIGRLNGGAGVEIWICVVIALAIGVAVGLANGFFVRVFGINPFIVTLGMGTLLLGITLLISNDQTYSGVSQGLDNITEVDRFLGIPLEFYYALGLCVVVWYVFEHTSLGRRLLFVGSGREVARLSGVRVERMRVGSLVVAGVLAALAGIFFAGTSGAANPTAGSTFLLPAFAAAFLGGTTIVPGRFNAWGTIVAAYFLVTGVTGLAILGAQSWVQTVFYGGALILAVAFAQLSKGRKSQEII
jgi:ribose transport system permease protein